MDQPKKLAADEDMLDLSQMVRSVKKFFSKSPENPSHKSETRASDTLSHKSSMETDSNVFDFKQMLNQTRTFCKTNAKWLIPLLFILIAVIASVYLRTMPLRMPIAEQWAAESVDNYYGGQIQASFNEQYPHLPPQNRQLLADREYQQFKEKNKQQIESQTKELAEQYRNAFRDSEGTVYLLGIDPYYYYHQTSLVLENGYPGSSLKEGVPWDDYRLAPLGREGEWNFHHWFGAVWHRFLNIFGSFPRCRLSFL